MVILGVDTDPTESASYIRDYAERSGFPWLMAPTHLDVVVGYGVRSQSTKIGIGSDGVVLFRGGYGTRSAQQWAAWMEELGAS